MKGQIVLEDKYVKTLQSMNYKKIQNYINTVIDPFPG